MAEKLKKKSLTIDDLLELICDVAYEQATREISGRMWFNEFIKKIDEKTKPIEQIK